MNRTTLRIIAFLCPFIILSHDAYTQANDTVADSLMSLVSTCHMDQGDLHISDTTCLWYRDELATHYMKNGQYGPAIAHADTCIKALLLLNETTTNKLHRKKIHRSLSSIYETEGWAYHFSGKHDKAIESYKREIRFAEQSGDTMSVAFANNFIANCFRAMNLPDKAMEYVNKAIAIPGVSRHPDALANFYSTKGSIFHNEAKKDSAWCYHIKAIDIFKKEKKHKQLITLYLNMLSLTKSHLEFDSLGHYLTLLKPLIEEYGAPRHEAMYLSHVGLMEMINHDAPSALKHLQQAEKMAREQEDKSALLYIHDFKTMLFSSQLQFDSALFYNSLAQQEILEILDVEKISALTESEANLRFEKEKALSAMELKREKTIKSFAMLGAILIALITILLFRQWSSSKRTSALLREQKERVEMAYAQLQTTQSRLILTEKQREAERIRVNIARDIHDEIGSGLTKITLLSELVKDKMHGDIHNAKISLTRISEYARGVNAALGEIVWAVNPQHDSVESLIHYSRTFTQQLLLDTGLDLKLDFTCDEAAMPISPELKRNIFLILKESLNNALKYSNAKNLEVLFHIQTKLFKLVVKDDGDGFDALNKVNSGNGLLNMQVRMTQLGCHFAVTSQPGSGCTVEAWGNLE